MRRSTTSPSSDMGLSDNSASSTSSEHHHHHHHHHQPQRIDVIGGADGQVHSEVRTLSPLRIARSNRSVSAGSTSGAACSKGVEVAYLAPTSPSTSTSTSGSGSGSASGSGSPCFSTPITPQAQCPLLRSPSEILHKVLWSSGGDGVHSIAQAAKTCRELRSFIYENPDQALWRDIHLSHYDDPRQAACVTEDSRGEHAASIDWKKRVQNRELVRRLITDWDGSKFAEVPERIDLICSTLLEIYLDLPPTTHSSDLESSATHISRSARNPSLLNTYLCSPLFTYMYINLSLSEVKSSLRPLPDQPGNPNRRSAKTVINPTLSRLHCLLPPAFDKDDISHRQFRGYLREMVYTGSNFQERNDWGPFLPDGTVDWTLVDAISSVMMANAQDILHGNDKSWTPARQPMMHGIEPARGLGYGNLERPSDLAEDAVWDWANVEGSWCGSYAFLDYADWVSLNEPRLILLRRTMNQLDLSRYTEAIGDLMSLELKLDRPGEPGSSETLPLVETHLPTSDLLPPIYFHGSSSQRQGSMTYPSQTPLSSVRGVARLTADSPPQVRWTLVIRYSGEDRWRLECVQVGGRGSKRGFFGTWTDALKEEHSPNGPVWYWRA